MCSSDLDPLGILLEMVTPVRTANRAARPEARLPDPALDRLADLADPDGISVRKLSGWVAQIKRHPEEISAMLRRWKENDIALQKLVADRVAWTEIGKLSHQLSELTTSGLEALDYWKHRKRPSASWTKRQRALLAYTAVPQDGIVIAIHAPIRDLVEAAIHLR